MNSLVSKMKPPWQTLHAWYDFYTVSFEEKKQINKFEIGNNVVFCCDWHTKIGTDFILNIFGDN